MKIDCKACKRTIEGDTELCVQLELVKHIRDTPDDEHRDAMSDALTGIDRILTCASMTALDDSEIRVALRDKCANFDSRLQTLYLYATSHLTFAIDVCREAILECGDESGVRDIKAARRLRSNLQNALREAETKFRQ